MGNKINLTRYYEMLDKIDQSEKACKEKAPAFLMRVKHNLYVADLNRQCRRPRK